MHTVHYSAKTQPAIAARYGQVSVPEVTETDLLIANLSDASGRPLVDYWISPLSSTLSPEFTGVQDRRNPGVRWMASSGGEIDIQGNRFIMTGNLMFTAGNSAPSNNNAFTVIARAKIGLAEGETLIGNERNSIGGTNYVNLGASGVLTSVGGTGNVSDNAGDLRGVDLVVAVTFSTERGVTIRRNGVQTYANASRTAPSVNTQIRIGGLGTSTNLFNGELGYVIYSFQDLSSPELINGLEAIEKSLLDMG